MRIRWYYDELYDKLKETLIWKGMKKGGSPVGSEDHEIWEIRYVAEIGRDSQDETEFTSLIRDTRH